MTKHFQKGLLILFVILNIMTQGRYTALHEKITGQQESPVIYNIALYEEETELIRRVWLMNEIS